MNNEHYPVRRSSRGQAMAPAPIPVLPDAFTDTEDTVVRWLGMSGFLINTRGTLLALDPLLEGFDMPLLVEFPVRVDQVPQLDAVLVTHADNDHYSEPTCTGLRPMTRAFHSTRYVGELMSDVDLPAKGHDIGETFAVESVRITLTPADHAWQNADPQPGQRVFQPEDACGFWIETIDGVIWAPGDSRLIREHHLHMPDPNAILFDFSDSEWHFGFDHAVELANTYPEADLVLQHWGSVDAPDFAPFNADPNQLRNAVDHPERVRVVAPGQPFKLTPRIQCPGPHG